MLKREHNDEKALFERKRRQAGFSLLEMLVSIIIFTVCLAAIYSLLEVARAGRNTSSERSDIMKQLRFSLNLMGRDAVNAGYSYQKNGAVSPDNYLAARLGVTADVNTDRDLLVGVVAVNNVFSNSLQDPANLRNTDGVSFVYRDTSFNPDLTTGTSKTLPIQTATSNPSETPMLTLAAGSNTSNCRVNDLYLIESQNSAVLAMATEIPSSAAVRFAQGDPLGVNQNFSNSVLRPCLSQTDENCMDYPAALKRVIWISFKVQSDGTLVRLVYGNNGTSSTQIQEQHIAYGVEDLQIKYVMQNGTVTNDPAAGVDGILGTTDDDPLNLNLVRQVNFTVTARGNDIDPRTGKPNRITMSATFSTRNMGFDVG
jgi:prepilin-type N-terminal cleavage/methylation domain-containing protein